MRISLIVFPTLIFATFFIMLMFLGNDFNTASHVDLDADSQIFLNQTGIYQEDLNSENFETENNITSDSETVGLDAYVREFQEATETINKIAIIMNLVYNIPDIILLSFGIENNNLILILKGFIYVGLSILIIFAIFNGIFSRKI